MRCAHLEVDGQSRVERRGSGQRERRGLAFFDGLRIGGDSHGRRFLARRGGCQEQPTQRSQNPRARQRPQPEDGARGYETRPSALVLAPINPIGRHSRTNPPEEPHLIITSRRDAQSRPRAAVQGAPKPNCLLSAKT